MVRQGRVLLARAMTTHTIDRVGHHLLVQTDTHPELVELVAGIRIGTSPRPTTTETKATKGTRRWAIGSERGRPLGH